MHIHVFWSGISWLPLGWKLKYGLDKIWLPKLMERNIYPESGQKQIKFILTSQSRSKKLILVTNAQFWIFCANCLFLAIVWIVAIISITTASLASLLGTIYVYLTVFDGKLGCRIHPFIHSFILSDFFILVSLSWSTGSDVEIHPGYTAEHRAYTH